ncbi:hypothetical protein [Streptomyces sp. NBC_01013]|uniref:hypothetical protein n=1 Tax=Streptomyces sp. NBC_01013 TaxID=2903718 RepID=UPI003870B4C8|nr:hypothetical protein OG538_22865 [Streptomyces sp. NBC_01013]
MLTVPGLTVVIAQGIQDIAGGSDDATVTSACTTVADMLRARGIKTVFSTLTPCSGYTPCTTAAEDTEAALAVSDAASTLDPPPLLLGNGAAPADFDAGDHVNLTQNGYIAAADAFGPSVLVPDVLPGGWA